MSDKELDQPINPPMDERSRQDNQHSQPADQSDQEHTGLQSPQATSAEGKRQQEQEQGTQPKERRRTKRRCAWIKANFFNMMLTIFTGLYAFGFLFDVYVSKRAYVTRGEPDKRAMVILPGDVGVEILLRNTGQTPVKRYAVQGWLLKEKETVAIQGPPARVSQHSISPGYPIRASIRWPDAPRDIPRIRNGELRVGVIWRIIYQDAFYIWHCEEYVTHYVRIPEEGFALTEGPSICDATTRRVRFNRVCVPSADKMHGAWGETWEVALGTDPNSFDPVPVNDPTPCYKKKNP